MTLNCTFLVSGVNSTGERDVLNAADNIVTAEGLKYLAGAQKFRTAAMPTEFDQYANCIFLGSGTRPTSISDTGLEHLELILPTANYSSYNSETDTFVTMPVSIPAGTYTEIAIGYYDPVTDTKRYYNRALLDTPLVVDAELYRSYAAIEFTYKFGMASGISGYGRISTFDVGGVSYNASIYTRQIAPWNEGGQFRLVATDQGAAVSGPLYTKTLTTTMKRLSPTPDNVAIFEITISNSTGATVPVEWVQVRNGNFLSYAIIYNPANKELPLTLENGKTLTLQLEFHYLSKRPTEYKLASTDGYEGSADYPLMLSSNTFYFNPASLKKAIGVNVESGVRTEYTSAQLNSTGDKLTAFIDEDARESKPEYLDVNSVFGTIPAKTTEIVKLYNVDFGTREHFVKVGIGTATDTFTFDRPSLTYVQSITNTATSTTGAGVRFSSKPSNADQVLIYDAYTDKLLRLDIFKSAAGDDAVIIPSAILNHDLNGTVAIKYSNKANNALKGVWRTLNTGAVQSFAETLPNAEAIPAVTTLARANAMTTPIINFKFDRSTKILTGYVLNATKVKIVGQDIDTSVYEFDVTPNKEFSIDLSTTNMLMSANYKFVAWNDTTGYSDGPVYNGFVSVSLVAISDAVYDSTALTITFTRPASYVKYAILRRWGFDFYRLELKDGTNSLKLTSALDTNGQWELIGVDEEGGESEPFYIFGAKPEDVPVKPASDLPEITPGTLNTSDTVKTPYIGFFVDKTETTRKWWEGLTWYGSIDDVTATVECKGVVSQYPADDYRYLPFLHFIVRAGEVEFAFELSPDKGVTVGHWASNGSFYQTRATVKLWHDWTIFDGNTDSELYYQERSESSKIYGAGNGYMQVTEIKAGFIRRGLGIVLNTTDSMVIGGACPINFDGELLKNSNALPTLAQHSPYMNVVFGAVMYQMGATGYMRIDQIPLYAVLINGKLATGVGEAVDYAGQSNTFCRSIVWTNEDGVAYRYDVGQWRFTRTDRDEHAGDAAYKDIVDTIQLCYANRANPQWYSHWAFQSDINYGRNFEPNIRQLQYGSYWQSVKGWIRPYYTPDALLTLTTNDLALSDSANQFIPFNFDTSLLDVGNQMVFKLNGETAALESIMTPQEILSYGYETTSAYNPNGDSRIVRNCPAGFGLYEDIAALTGTVATYFGNWQNIPTNDWYDSQNIFEIPVVGNEKTIYELYRTRLPDASSYLTYDELFPALYVNNLRTFGIDLSKLSAGLLTKKLLVPIAVKSDYLAEMRESLENVTKIFKYIDSAEGAGVTTAEFLTAINNPGLADATKVISASWHTTVIGHRSFDLSSRNYRFYNSWTSPRGNGSTSTYDENRMFVGDFTATPTIITDNNFVKPADIYSFPVAANGERIMATVVSSSPTLTSALSNVLFGEDRGYETSVNTNLVSKSGLFNLPYARSLGLTGKYLLATLVNNRLLSNAVESNAFVDRDSYFGNVSPDNTESYVRGLLTGKPIMGWWSVVNYVEIDLSLSDAELAEIVDQSTVIWSFSTPYVSRIGVSADGFDRYYQPPEGGFGDNVKTGIPLATGLTPAYVVATSNPEYTRRKISSANYTIEEVSGADGLWFISRGLEINSKDDNYVSWKNFKVTVATTKVNSLNIFANSQTSSRAKQIGDDLGRYLNITTNGYTPATPVFAPQMDDPRIYPQLGTNQSYGFAIVIFKALTYYRGQGAVGVSDRFAVSCNGRLVKVIPATDISTNYYGWSSAEYVTNKVYAKFVDAETGEHIANLVVSITGYSAFSADIVLVTEVPDLYLFTCVMGNLDSTLQSIINSLYSATAISSTSFYIGCSLWVYDYSNLPVLNSPVFDFTDMNINSYISPAEFANPGNYDSLPLPYQDLVETRDNFLANFNVYVNGRIATSISSENVTETFKGVSISAIKYTIVTPDLTFALYYANDEKYGGYRGEVISFNTNSVEKNVIVFESLKTSIRDENNLNYKPTFGRYIVDYDSYDTSFNENNSDKPYWIYNGTVYYTMSSDGAFVKKSAAIVIKNNDYENTGKTVRSGWLTALKDAQQAFVAAALYEFDDYNSSWEFVQPDASLVPVAIESPAVYVGRNAPVLSYDKYNTDTGFGYESYNYLVTNFWFEMDYNLNLEEELPEFIHPKVMSGLTSQHANTMDYAIVVGLLRVAPSAFDVTGESPAPEAMAMSAAYVEGGDTTPPDTDIPLVGIYASDSDATEDEDGWVSPYSKILASGQYSSREVEFGHFLGETLLTNEVSGETALLYQYASINQNVNEFAVESISSYRSRDILPIVYPPVLWCQVGESDYYDGSTKYLKVYPADMDSLEQPSISNHDNGDYGHFISYRFEDTVTNESSNYYQQSSYTVIPNAVQRSDESHSEALIGVPYYDLFYATPWIDTQDDAGLRFFDTNTGLPLTFEEAKVLIDECAFMDITREVREVNGETHYRWFLWQRFENRYHEVTIDRDEVAAYDYAVRMIKASGTDARYKAVDDAFRLGNGTFPLPNLNALYFERGNETPPDTYIPESLEAGDLNRVYHMSIDEVAGVWANVEYNSETYTLTFDWIHPYITISYSINALDQSDNTNIDWNNLTWGSSTATAVFAPGIETVNIFACLNVWLRGGYYDFWAPYGFTITGANDGSVASGRLANGVYAVVTDDTSQNIEVEAYVYYNINETRALPGERDDWVDIALNYTLLPNDAEPIIPDQPIVEIPS